jgi:hypothetical protein
VVHVVENHGFGVVRVVENHGHGVVRVVENHGIRCGACCRETMDMVWCVL